MPLFPRFLAFALTALAALGSADAAEAGWVTFKNDTGRALVVQEFATVHGKKVCGKPYKLLPGESFREFQNTPGVKSFEVLDASNPGTVLWRSSLDCKRESQSFSITGAAGRVLIIQTQDVKRP